MKKKLIDIEKLLSWSVRDELPKGQAVAASPWDIITQFCALGVRVQTSHSGEGFGFTPGAPHEDALAVAAAVRALPNDGTLDMPTARQLFADLLPIAGDAPRAISLGAFDARSLVISNATLGARPKWRFEDPTPRQMFTEYRNARGELRTLALVQGVDADGDLVEMRRNEGRARKRDGEYTASMLPRSPLVWGDPSPLHIGECRAEYVIWYEALDSLALALSGTLTEFEPLPPAAAARPWLANDEPISRIIVGRDLASLDAEIGLSPRRDRPALAPVVSPIEAKTRRAYAVASRTKMRKTPTAIA